MTFWLPLVPGVIAFFKLRAQVEEWKKNDPISLCRARFLGAGASAAGELEPIDAAVQAEVDDAVRFAEESPWPDPATACEYVFSAR